MNREKRQQISTLSLSVVLQKMTNQQTEIMKDYSFT